MGYTWNQTKHEGVRYREHPTRKHGVKPDQYFVIRYRVEGKRREEALGWASQGWTAAKAAQALAKLQEAARTGEGCVTLAEKRKQAEARREQARQEEEARARDLVTFGQIFHDSYMPAARLNKSKVSCDKEDGFYRNWIGGVLGDKPLVEIAPFDLERLKKVMLEAGKSPKTTHYCLAVVRQVFNFAKRNGLFHGDNPVAFVKKPTADNRRLRFLTHDEADRLLSAWPSGPPTCTAWRFSPCIAVFGPGKSSPDLAGRGPGARRPDPARHQKRQVPGGDYDRCREGHAFGPADRKASERSCVPESYRGAHRGNVEHLPTCG